MPARAQQGTAPGSAIVTTLALASLLPALAVVPLANAVVQSPWVVVRWDPYGDCKIWRNDVNGPWGPGWRAVAFARTYPEAWAKMQALYARVAHLVMFGLLAAIGERRWTAGLITTRGRAPSWLRLVESPTSGREAGRIWLPRV